MSGKLKCKRLTLADDWMNHSTRSDISPDKTCYSYLSLNMQITGDDPNKAGDNE